MSFSSRFWYFLVRVWTRLSPFRLSVVQMTRWTRGAIVKKMTRSFYVIFTGSLPSYCSILSIQNVTITITFTFRVRGLGAAFTDRASFVINAADYHSVSSWNVKRREKRDATVKVHGDCFLQDASVKCALVPTFRTLLSHSFVIDYLFTPSDVSPRRSLLCSLP
jgi:hypothetical protein